jgi:hypothetical protein
LLPLLPEGQISFVGQKKQKPFVNPEVPWSQASAHQKTGIAAFGGYQNLKGLFIMIPKG